MITDWTEAILDLRDELAELTRRVQELEAEREQPESTDNASFAAAGSNESMI